MQVLHMSCEFLVLFPPFVGSFLIAVFVTRMTRCFSGSIEAESGTEPIDCDLVASVVAI